MFWHRKNARGRSQAHLVESGQGQDGAHQALSVQVDQHCALPHVEKVQLEGYELRQPSAAKGLAHTGLLGWKSNTNTSCWSMVLEESNKYSWEQQQVQSSQVFNLLDPCSFIIDHIPLNESSLTTNMTSIVIRPVFKHFILFYSCQLSSWPLLSNGGTCLQPPMSKPQQGPAGGSWMPQRYWDTAGPEPEAPPLLCSWTGLCSPSPQQLPLFSLSSPLLVCSHHCTELRQFQLILP